MFPEPQHASAATDRPWYKKKRFMVPIGSFVALVAIGSAIPADDENGQTTIAEATATPEGENSASLAAALQSADAARESLKAQKAQEAEQQEREDAAEQAEAKAKAKARAKAKAKARARAKAEAREKKEEEARKREQEEDEPVDVYYANCSAVRAAGADPIYAGDPGYSRKLDRDGDGVACE